MSRSGRRGTGGPDVPDRAVIDIGSNTVRLVVYAGSRRAPEVFLNEKVSAKLGRDLSTTGEMPGKAMEQALKALARYATLLADLEIDDVQTVATAAVRDAANGEDFLERVRALGLAPRLLSGEEEALTSAHGVMGAFPGATGTIADLGGGSLELVMMQDGICRDPVSLPLGTLRLPALCHDGPDRFEHAIRRELAHAGWAASHPGPLYMVGGTWRALATYAMRTADCPLTDPHGLRLSLSEADHAARRVAHLTPAELRSIRGISSSRAASLPDAAAMLRVMLREMQPDGLIFSSWGLREGLLYERLSAAARQQDPLLAAIGHFCEPRGGMVTVATLIAAWTADIAGDATPGGTERLRLAATMLALAAARVEPNLRARHAYGWAMHKRWLGLSPEARAQLAAALMGSFGKSSYPAELSRLASEQALRDAVGWGLAIRLCRRLGAGSRISLVTSRLWRENGTLVLWLDDSRAQLATGPVPDDLKTLARWLDLDHELRIGEATEPLT